VGGDGVQGIDGLQMPPRGDYRVEVWLSDEEGNVGAPASMPAPRDTTPPAAPQFLSVAAPKTARSAQGFDLRWHNIVDAGSPINAAHYQVLGGDGRVVVQAKSVLGENPEAIPSIDVPEQPGAYQLRLWLSDAEGNAGAPVTAPLSYECVRSSVPGGTSISAGFGPDGSREAKVEQGQGAFLQGTVRGPQGGVGKASVCVFSRIATKGDLDFLGTALTDTNGNYRFGTGPGPSRAFEAVYRPDQRQIGAEAVLKTRVHPTLTIPKRKLRNKQYIRFVGDVPGPDARGVLITIQVKSGKGWRVMRRFATDASGHYDVRYRLNKSNPGTEYVFRAQVRGQPEYSYEPGDSETVSVWIVDKRARARR
jgi:hypothetical protein